MSEAKDSEDPVANYLRDSLSGEVIFDLTTFQSMCRSQPSDKFSGGAKGSSNAELRRLLYSVLLKTYATTHAEAPKQTSPNRKSSPTKPEGAEEGDKDARESANSSNNKVEIDDDKYDEATMFSDLQKQVKRWVKLDGAVPSSDNDDGDDEKEAIDEIVRAFASEARDMITFHCTSSAAKEQEASSSSVEDTTTSGSTDSSQISRCTPYMVSVCGPLLTLLPPLHETEDPSAGFDQLLPTFAHLMNFFVPRAPACVAKFRDACCALFRLLLQYHEPSLSMHLDHHSVPAAELLYPKLLTLLVADDSSVGFECCPASATVLEFWDWLLIYQDPLLLVFALLRLLAAHSSELLALSGKDATSRRIAALTLKDCGLSMKDLVSDAIRIAKNTPSSVKQLFRGFLFNPERSALVPSEVKSALLGSIALPIHSSELVRAFALQKEGQFRHSHLNYVVLDCRSEKSFNFARLPTALHVGPHIGFDPELLKEMLERFRDAKGSHFCILGTGRELAEETNLLQIIALQFVTQGFRYVGVAEGGFKALIPFIKSGKIEYTRTPDADAAASSAREGSISTNNDDSSGHQAGQTTSDSLQKAATEAAAIASQGLTSAKSWGLGIFSKVKSQVAQHRTAQQQQHQDPNNAAAATAIASRNEAGANRSAVGESGAGNRTTRTVTRQEPQQHEGNSRQKNANTNTPGARAQQEKKKAAATTQPQQQPMFTMNDDDEDDYDLITTVAPTSQGPSTKAEKKEEGEEEEEEKASPETPLYGDYTPSASATMDGTEQATSPPPKPATTATTTKSSGADSNSKNSDSATPHPFDDIFGDDDD